MASDEIERFRREIVERGGKLAADLQGGKELDDVMLLREVMNTVGKYGQLGGAIRCVVSVSMLTEGWDANTVTHVLGVRAFGTQLLCEQVIGRALRRQSYDLNEEYLFNVEYADVFGKVLIDDLVRQSKEARAQEPGAQVDLFADFNGMAKGVDRTEFYAHDQNWSNRMILGDSLQVMASLAEREGLRGKVQCIYFDPPYGIKFNSNFQWSTTSRDVKDGNVGHITREPEQVKAFRDTWRDGIHSYLTYLRDRLTVARDLLTDSGSIFVQIGDENVHRVRALMDEAFGAGNFVSLVTIVKTTGAGSQILD